MTVMTGTMLLVWPLVTLMLFIARGPVSGLIWATLVGYLLLPERHGFDLPILPPYKKYAVICYALLIAFLIAGKLRPEDKKEEVVLGNNGFRVLILSLLSILMVSAFLTFLTNRSSIANGGVVLPGLGLQDALIMVGQPLVALIPFFLARHYLATPEHHRMFLKALVILSVGYAFLALFEIRMSPQLNNWVYGFFPHHWLQHIRGNGFRPLIFLDHGLSLGFLLFMAMIAVCALLRQDPNSRAAMLCAAVILFGTLLISKNLGALMLTVLFAPLLLVCKTGTQARVVALVAVLFLIYPLLRTIAPVDAFTDLIANFSAERAFSLNYRLQNETLLLERANEKPLAGWGIWSRAQLYAEAGYRTTTTDGTWIIILGEQGWIGYLSFFGLMAMPMIFLARTGQRKELPVTTMALAVIGAGNLIYMIPNSTLSPVNWLIFGALAGFIEKDVKHAKTAESESPEALSQPRSPYTRFGQGVSSTAFARPVAQTRTGSPRR